MITYEQLEDLLRTRERELEAERLNAARFKSEVEELRGKLRALNLLLPHRVGAVYTAGREQHSVHEYKFLVRVPPDLMKELGDDLSLFVGDTIGRGVSEWIRAGCPGPTIAVDCR